VGGDDLEFYTIDPPSLSVEKAEICALLAK